MKTCRKCKASKPLVEFYETKRFSDGHMRECAECCKAKTKAWRISNPEKNREMMIRSFRKDPERRNLLRRNRRNEIKHTAEFKLQTRNSELWKKYGVKPEHYSHMLNGQDGCCAICGVNQSALKKRLHVDHDHATNSVRGLLCSTCNTGLGHFRDDPKLLENALVYIYEHITRKN